jgi:hypothetical protein
MMYVIVHRDDYSSSVILLHKIPEDSAEGADFEHTGLPDTVTLESGMADSGCVQ